MSHAEYVEMPLPMCTCGQLPERPVENPVEKWTDAMSFEKAKAFSNDQTLVALVHAVDVLAARLEALELQFAALTGILDRPLSPTESMEELRRLREGMA